jgi:hypothetical protein
MDGYSGFWVDNSLKIILHAKDLEILMGGDGHGDGNGYEGDGWGEPIHVLCGSTPTGSGYKPSYLLDKYRYR